MPLEDTERYREFIINLQREELRPIALAELKNLLTHKPTGDAANTIRDVGLGQIMKCLSLKDKVQVDLTCDILRMCFEKFAVGEAIRLFTGNIMFMLRHDKPCVRQLAIDEVFRCLSVNPDILPVPEYIDLFVATGQLVSDTELAIANKAILITSQLHKEAYPRVLEEMKICLEYNTSSKCNAYEVVVNISTRDPELLTLCAEKGYMSSLLSELDTSDVLYQMNLLELLSRLAMSPQGIAYLVENGALVSLAKVIEELKNNPLGIILAPGYLKFIGSIAHMYPRQIIEKYPAFINFLLEAFDAADQTILPVALDTLGFIGSKVGGKQALAAVGSKFTLSVQIIGQLIRTSTTEMKVRSLHCMANLIGYETDPEVLPGKLDHRVTLMCREWFRSLSSKPDSMTLVYELCKNPFPDLKLAAFTLLDAACQHNWGSEFVAQTPGFAEYLLDRKVDASKECNETKYSAIKKLAGSSAFDTNMVVRFQKYVEEGPFRAESVMQVAMDDE